MKKSEGGVKGHSKKGHKTPSATTTGLGLPAYGFQPSAGTAGKYICVTDFVHKQRPSDFPSCRSGSDCSKRHIPKPASGQFAAKDKAEVLTSISRLNHLSADQKATLSAIVQAVV